MKVSSICTQFALCQCISTATHFTEHSESIIDLLLVSNNIVTCGVGDPCLQQDTRFHCPIYGILKFAKQESNLLNVESGNKSSAGTMMYYAEKLYY